MRKSLCILLFLLPVWGFAGQFLGGELSYRVVYTDPTSTRYEVTLKIYRNCSSLADLPDPVIKFMNTVDITRNTHPLKYTEEIFTGRNLVYLPKTAINPCVLNTPPDCYEMITWKKEVDLPYSPEGYTIFYAFCCRDEAGVNIRRETWNAGSEIENQVIVPGQGLTFFTRIPRQDSVALNSSPIITTDSVISACLQRPLYYRFQFTDPDGDSLVYAWGRPHAIATTAHTTFQDLFYNPGYSATAAMGGNPVITLDAKTGVLKGIPDRKGGFLLPIEISEYRNNKLINVHRKEVQVNVYDCNIQKIPDIINCNHRTISILNPNRDINQYAWDFGVDTSTRDTSTAYLPVFQYPGFGDFKVKMKGSNVNGCVDSLSFNVKIYPKMDMDYTWRSPVCNGDSLLLTDVSSAGGSSISKRTWKNATRSAVLGHDLTLHVVYRAPNSVIYPVSVWLVAEAANGCRDSVLKAINIYPRVKANAGPDTTIAFDIPYQMKGSGGNQYQWSPATGLSNATIPNPVLTINRDQQYILTVSNDGFCGAKDTVFIRYMKGPDVYVPDAFTPNNDGRNDVFKAYSVSLRIKSMEVFNRFGFRVFSTTQLSRGWDGTVNSVPQQAGTYVWVIHAEDKDGKTVTRQGTMLLIR